MFTQFDEHLPLQVRHLLGGLVQGAAELHLGPQQLQAVSDHVVHVDGERVVLGPNVQALLPPDVPLHTKASLERVRAPRVRAVPEERTYLEVDEEAVELLLAGAAVEVLPAGVQQGAHQADPEQVLRGVQGAGAAVLAHPEGGEGEQGAEDDGRLHHAVVVQLAQELGAADSPLVELGLIDLEQKN